MGSWRCNVAVVGVMMLAALFVCVHSLSVPSVELAPGKVSLSKRRCGPVCLIYCPFGNVLDFRGCPTCKCRKLPGNVSFSKRRCGPVCLIYCPYGNVLDFRGCPTCKCRKHGAQFS